MAPSPTPSRTTEAHPGPTPADSRIVLFDGVCNLCNGFVQFIIKRDPKARFRFGALQSAEAQELLKDSPLRPADLSTIIYVKDGRTLVRSTAALRILKDIGGVWALWYVFIIVPPFLRDAVYRWVARNRYKWFGRRETCMVPTPDLRARFLDGLRG